MLTDLRNRSGSDSVVGAWTELADEPQPAPEGDDLALGLWVVGNGAWQLVLDGRIRDAAELLSAEAHRAVDRGALAIAAEHCELALRFGAATPLPVAPTESGEAAPQRFRAFGGITRCGRAAAEPRSTRWVRPTWNTPA